MDRITLKLKLKLDRVDVMLACALVVVVSSYTLGYRLDWNQLDQAASAEASVAGTPSGPALAESPATMAAALQTAIIAAPAPAVVAPVAAKAQLVPDPREAEWELMTHELNLHASKHRGRVAVVVEDLKSGRQWTYHPDDLFPSASLIKVPVMICVF